ALAKSLKALGPYEQLECVKALGESGDPAAAPAVLEAARAQDKGQGRSDCILALEKLGNGAIGPLLEGLKDAHPGVRSISAGALGALAFRMRGTDAGKVPETFGKVVAPIAALLKDAEPAVRGSAADALGSLHLPEAVPALLNALGDPDPAMQEILPRVLSYFPAEAVDALVALLRHDDFPVRRSAAETLGEIALRGQGAVAVESPEGRAIAECEQGLKRRNAEFISGAYLYYIRKGQSGAVLYLVDTLNTLGDKRMAETYLNCGNADLAEAAKNWAKDNGYTISERHAGSGYKWGGK
ncbi:MAG: HEAT repeat domain-containing protein, partial [Planctomycetota bacterium]|nr:HEAT repeat domain-containing protein [Planctomycetota bacterium]